MRRSRFVILTLFIAACGTTSEPSTKACGDFPAAPYPSFAADRGPLTVELRTAPHQPPQRGVGCAELRVKDANGSPKDGLSIEIVPFMPAHGHGSNTAPVVQAEGDGVYRVESIDLSMPGTWELRMTFTAQGLEAHATTNLEVL